MKRLARWTVALALIVLGLVLSIPGIPGPGLLIVLVGVFVLLPESRWLRKKVRRAQTAVPEALPPDRIAPRARAAGSAALHTPRAVTTTAQAALSFVARVLSVRAPAIRRQGGGTWHCRCDGSSRATTRRAGRS